MPWPEVVILQHEHRWSIPAKGAATAVSSSAVNNSSSSSMSSSSSSPSAVSSFQVAGGFCIAAGASLMLPLAPTSNWGRVAVTCVDKWLFKLEHVTHQHPCCDRTFCNRGSHIPNNWSSYDGVRFGYHLESRGGGEYWLTISLPIMKWVENTAEISALQRNSTRISLYQWKRS